MIVTQQVSGGALGPDLGVVTPGRPIPLCHAVPRVAWSHLDTLRGKPSAFNEHVLSK